MPKLENLPRFENVNLGSDCIPFRPERLWFPITLAGRVVISASTVSGHRNELILGFKNRLLGRDHRVVGKLW
jgi:hypothetical protein